MANDRVIEDVSTEDTLATDIPFIGDLTTLDAITAATPPFAIMMIGQMIAPPEYSDHVMYVVLITGIIGLLALVATPHHTPLGKFMQNFLHHQRRPSKVRYRRNNESEDVLDRSFLEYDERAQDLTEVNRIYPQYDTLELDDGTMVGALRVTSANLDTADPQRQMSAIQEAKDFFENTLNFDLQLYITTHGFDAETALSQYRERLNDDELKNNPILEYHCRNHIRWVTQRMGGRPIREFYMVVPVTREEIREQDEDDETVSSSLEALPVIGKAFGVTVEDDYKMTTNEVRLEQISEVDSRLETLRSQFVNAIGEETEAERVVASQYAAILREFWEGELVDDDEFKHLIGKLPIIIGENDDVPQLGDHNE